ncbi:MAG TPA: M28 family peptidase [Gammaproteobacteria bacterium]|nr:M28 family peptidase [Gammaproteobacteria bacterium]
MATFGFLARSALGLALGVVLSSCRAPSEPTNLNPTIEAVVAGVSEERIEANLRKLEGFGTRYILSGHLGPQRGIDAAKDWLVQELSSYGPRLQVSVQSFSLPKGAAEGQVLRDVDLGNVVAVLPGRTDPAHQILITAHYDTVNLHLRPVPSDDERVRDLVERRRVDETEARRMTELFPRDAVRGRGDEEATAAAEDAPGVSDDGSGVAALLELARVMSQYEFEKTLVFVAFSAEEVALEGSKFYATRARDEGAAIEAVLNNDIIGTVVAGNGRTSADTVRVFGDGPEDSPSRALLRYTKLVGERYVPSMRVQMVFRRDRFGRGGDHTSFLTRGFAAVRLTSAAENYEQQHNAADTLENMSVAYATRVARINAAVAASLASAPSAPVVNYTIGSGMDEGNRLPLLSRGQSGYAASLRWTPPAAADVAAYTVMIRDTTAPDWQRAIPVGAVTRHVIENLSIDDVVIGVKATDRDGNESMVAAYLEPVAQRLTAPPAASTVPAASSEPSSSE